MDEASRNRLSVAGLFLSLLLSIVAIYWKTVFYPFIYDDWGILRTIIYGDKLEYLAHAFSPVGKILYRPLGSMYFLLTYIFFKLDPRGFHLISLIIHFLNSLLVVRIVKELSKDAFIGWVVGFLYAVAVTVHIEPLLWLAGFYDVGGALFYFLSIYLFLGRKYSLSAFVYCLGILTKETVVALPVLLLMSILITEGNSRPRFGSLKSVLSKLGLHAIFLIAYALIKLIGVSPLTVAGNDSFRIAFTGPHIANNLLKYATWAISTVLAGDDVWKNERVLFIICLGLIVALAAAWILMYRRGERDFRIRLTTRTFFWTAWSILGVIPVVFLEHHADKYFLIYSLVPFFALLLLGLRLTLLHLHLKNSVVQTLIILIVVSNLYSSSGYLAGQSQKPNFISGTYSLIQKAEVVDKVKSFLEKEYPFLPHGSALVFYRLETASFLNENGPQVWYNDTTLRVYQTNQIRRDSVGISILARRDDHSEKIYVDTTKTFVFLLYYGEVRRYDLSLQRSGDPDE